MKGKVWIASLLAVVLVGSLVPTSTAETDEDRAALADYLAYAEEHDIPVEERSWSFQVPAGDALHLKVDLRTLEATATAVPVGHFGGLPVTGIPTGGGGNDPNCLSVDWGRVHLATTGPVNTHGAPGGQTPCEEEVHTTGTDFAELIMYGDGYTIINAGLDWQVGFGFVWLECESGQFWFGPYEDEGNYACYANIGGTAPQFWWQWDAALLDRNRDPEHFVWAKMHFVD